MSNRRKKKKNNKKLVSIFLLIFILLSIPLFIFKDKVIDYITTFNSHYNKEAIKVLKESNKFKEINSKKYSKTLEEIVNTEYYNSKYIDSYIEIDYQEDKKFLENITALLNIGYSSGEINNIYSKLDNDKIEIIINNKYIDKISDILKLSYFKGSLLDRYIAFYNSKEYNYTDAITYVNIGLDKDYYTNVINLDNRDDLTVIVNKYHNLGSDYIPSDLVEVKSSYRTKYGQLKRIANDNFEKMADDAKKEGILLLVSSGYRSYTTQYNLYNYYVSVDGKKEADTYSARPGYSEHQTGLAIDIAGSNWNFIEDNTSEYNWLINNAHKYGFILRYPKDKEWITGYMYEPWHYRYVGDDISKYIQETGLTYDEYMARK